MKKLDIEGLSNEAPKEAKKDEQEGNIAFSSKLVAYFTEQAKAFKKEHKTSLTLDSIKKAYCHGARLGKANKVKDLNLYALARVNMFLRLKSGDSKMIQKESSSSDPKKPIELELEASKQYKRVSAFIDISEGWIPNEDDFQKAQKEIDKNDLKHEYENISDLYLEYEPIDTMWD